MKRRKKVLMLASVASMIAQFNLPNICLLQELGYEVHVLCNFREGNTCDAQAIAKLKQTLRQMQVTYESWDCPRNICMIGACSKAYRQLWELTGRQQYDFLHCHSPIGGALARLAAHRRKLRVIYTAHGFHFYKGAPLKNWLLYYPAERLLSYWTDVLLTVNREDYLFAKKHLKAGSIGYIPGVGIDCQRFQAPVHGGFRKKYGIAKDAAVLLSVGELSRRKNHKVVLSALARLKQKNVYYLICGQGKLKKTLMRKAAALGIAERVKMPGYEENIELVYQNADIFVFPSRQEGMPAALMEAMAAGLPCIVSDIRGSRELIGGCRAGGIRFPADNAVYLSRALESLLSNEPLRALYGRRNQMNIQAYRIEKVNERMKRIYARMGRQIKISVLIAVYMPNLRWLKQLLCSVSRQSYPIYEILIMDDGSKPDVFAKIQQIAGAATKRIKRVSIYRSSQREGSDRTFEKLSLLAKGDYLAFCDQDDIWEPEKLERLAQAAVRERAVMVYSDVSVIDANGRLLHKSLRGMRKWMRFVQGEQTTAKYLAENCTLGCSMLAKADFVKKAVPFYRHTYCDHWIAIFLSAHGKIAFVNEPLVRYRRHSTNQTGSLRGIKTKQDYYVHRMLPMYKLVKEVKSRGISFAQEDDAAAFAKARKEKDIRGIFKYRACSPKYACFDLMMLCLPKAAAELLLWAIRGRGGL